MSNQINQYISQVYDRTEKVFPQDLMNEFSLSFQEAQLHLSQFFQQNKEALINIVLNIMYENSEKKIINYLISKDQLEDYIKKEKLIVNKILDLTIFCLCKHSYKDNYANSITQKFRFYNQFFLSERIVCTKQTVQLKIPQRIIQKSQFKKQNSQVFSQQNKVQKQTSNIIEEERIVKQKLDVKSKVEVKPKLEVKPSVQKRHPIQTQNNLYQVNDEKDLKKVKTNENSKPPIVQKKKGGLIEIDEKNSNDECYLEMEEDNEIRSGVLAKFPNKQKKKQAKKNEKIDEEPVNNNEKIEVEPEFKKKMAIKVFSSWDYNSINIILVEKDVYEEVEVEVFERTNVNKQNFAKSKTLKKVQKIEDNSKGSQQSIMSFFQKK